LSPGTSYRGPRISSLRWARNANASSVIGDWELSNLNTTGGDIVEIVGTNFGYDTPLSLSSPPLSLLSLCIVRCVEVVALWVVLHRAAVLFQ
jgi:hypothetical protein